MIFVSVTLNVIFLKLFGILKSCTKFDILLSCYRYHHLKLYPEDESGPLSTKKPIVVESYDEIVLSKPSEAFLARVHNHPAVSVPRLPADLALPPAGVF